MSSQNVTNEMLDKWDEDYSAGNIPKGYRVEGRPHAGRPKLYDGEMSSITIRMPAKEKERLDNAAKQRGISLSAYVRDLIAANS